MTTVRSMNGINNIDVNEVEFPDGSTITSASNLVQLDTNNNFISNNTFNVNLPTSSVNPDLGDINNNTMLNKFSADKLYSATDENDFITAFTRDGATGVITLTQADTGTPITSESITTITDEQIIEIGVNTNKVGITPTQATAIENNTAKVGITTTQATAIENNTAKVGITTTQATAITNNATAISNLTTNTNPCFKSASIDGQILSLTPISGSATNITIPSGSGSGTALLSAGTSGSEQTFTGFNKFDEELKLGGDLRFTQQGTQNMTFSNTNSTNTSSITQNTNRNWVYQIISTGGTTNNQFNQIGVLNDTGITNQIFQEKAQINNIIQDGVNNNFIQRDGTATITQEGNNSKITTAGKIGINTTNPSCELDVIGKTKLQNGGAYIYVFSGDIRISGNATSYTSWGNGGHHIDTYTTSNGAGRRMYINYYANQGVTLTRSNITSDDRIKEEEKFIENATDTLLKLRPQTYIKYAPVIDGSTIKPNFDLSGNFESGLIAQEIYYDAPELKHIVSITDMSNDDIIPSSDDPTKDPDYSDWGDMTAGVDYIQIIPYLIKSNQELHERILKLENKINV